LRSEGQDLDRLAKMTVTTTEYQIDVTGTERDQDLDLPTANTPGVVDLENIVEGTHAREDLIPVIATEIEEIGIEEIVSLGVVETKMAQRDLKKTAVKQILEE
jgi:hypothetical protein